jgi:hypothetical protein
MGFHDENDLPDTAIKAMWDEGEPVELADGPEGTVVEVTPSPPWYQPTPKTTATGWISRTVVYLSSFGAATARYPVDLHRAGTGVTATPSA